MELKDLQKKIEDTKEYKQLKEKQDLILTHILRIQEKDKDTGWEFGYFDKDSNKITVFEQEPFKVREPDEMLSEDNIVEELKLDEVKTSFLQADNKVQDFAKEKGVLSIVKKIFILQKKEGLIWNITYLTNEFKLLNIKIDAITGEIVHSDVVSVFDLGLKT